MPFSFVFARSTLAFVATAPVWLAVLHFFQGENWHRNHHAKPSAARFGWKLWQIDFGWYAIVMLEMLGLATSVKRVSSTD